MKKRLVALFLVLAMLLGSMGTAAIAAEATEVQMPSVTIGADGTVTVNGVTNAYENGYAYVYPKGETTGYKYVELTWDSDKKVYTGKNSDIAGGQLYRLRLNSYKNNDDNTIELEDRVSISNNYIGGKLTYSSTSVYNSTSKAVKLSYTDDEGKAQTATSWVETASRSEQVEINYDSETGKKTKEFNSVSEKKGDEKAYTTKSNNTQKQFDKETGKLIQTATTETESEYEYYQVTDSDWAYLAIRNKKSDSKTEYKNYDDEGEFTGSRVDTIKTSNEYENDKKTYLRDRISESYNKNGLKTGSSRNTETHKYTGNNKTDSWTEDSYKDEYWNYNQDNVLTSNNIYEYTYGDKSSNIYTYRNYNAYTKQMTSERINKNQKNDNGVREYYNSEAYYNDNGTLRYKYVNDFDGIITHYNKDNKVVATKDKDGTWKDGSGKVIGKNEDKDGNSQNTEVSFKSRTGEIDSYSIRTTTSKDGEWVSETKYYDGNGKETSGYKYVSKADRTWEYYDNGVLRYSDKDGEEKYFDYKGNLESYSKYDAEKDEKTWYNFADRKTSMTGPDYGEEYDKDEKVVRSWKTVDGKTSYYDGKNQLLYSEGYDEDGAKVYYGKDGKEFAREYRKDETDENVSTMTRERIYGEEHYYGDGDSYTEYEYWDPDNNSGTMEKIVSKSESENKAGVYTSNDVSEYTKWDVINGKKQNEVTRKETSTYVEDDKHTEQKSYKDGVLSYSSETEKNEYGKEVKTTTKYFDWYTGKQTNAYKTIKSGIQDDPISYYKSYDKYNNLQSYSETDNTDMWDWTKSYYASGARKGESWSDGLDYDESYSISYYLNGNPSRKTTDKDDKRTTIQYNKDGTYRKWTESADGVTNTWNYDNHGTLTGYIWNEKSEDGYYSYEYWDASKLLYTYTSESLADGWTETTTDPDGNKLVWKNGESTLTLANKATSGWQSAIGEWFYLENGKPVKNDWRQIDGNWYYFNYEGAMVNGIKSETSKDGNVKTYAISKDGTLSTGGWTEIYDGGWAYTDQNGEVLTGWQQIGGNWYYFDDGWTYNKTDYKADANWSQNSWKGEMVTGAARIWNSDWTDKHTYFFNEDGTWDNSPGWKTAELNGEVEYHYYDQNRNEVTGWKQIDGKWYYFNDDGVLKNGWVGNYYLDPANGSAMATGWVQEVYEDWYYLNEDGTMKTGWLEDGGNWYYLKDSGAMASDEWVTSGSNSYYLTESGTMASGWAEDNGNWYYLDPANGDAMATGWVQSGDTWYYMDPDTGAMVSDCEVEVNGTTYKFDANGAWVQ